MFAAGCDSASTGGDAQSKPVEPKAVVALGRLEPAGGVIAISAMPGDRLKRYDPDVQTNKPAPENGVLGLLASYDLRRAQLDALETKLALAGEKHQLDLQLAAARLKQAEATLAQATAKRTEVLLQETRLEYLAEAAAIAADSYKQLAALQLEDPELVTAQQLRRQKNRADQAQIDFQIARDSYASAVAAADSAHAAAQAGRDAAEQSLLKLETLNPARAVVEEIKVARQNLAGSVLWAPNIDPAAVDATQVEFKPGDPPGPFTVLKTFLRPGEFVTQMPVMQLGDLSDIICVAEVYEAEAKLIRPDQEAIITSRAFRKGFEQGIKGRVVSVSQVVSSPGLTPRNPLAPVDRSVVEVRVRVDPKNAAALAEAASWVGLQATVTFPKP